MKPFLVTTLQAARMPRWVVLLVCLLYVVPGLVGRDPWRVEDAEGFGIAHTMALAERGGFDWLVPNVAGLAIVGEGPLPFWMGAAAMRLLPWLDADAAFQFVAMGWLLLLLGGVWYATYLLARRPEVQPADLFGASASRRDFGRAIADCALLVTVATFGLLARVHETTAEAAQLAWIGLFLLGCALALERPRLAGLLVGVAIGFTTLSRGIAPALALALTAAALTILSGPFRLVAWPFTLRWVPLAIAISIAWPLALAVMAGGEPLRQWLDWNLAQVAGPSSGSLRYALQTAPWFFWPAWPLAAWAVWRWHGRGMEPALALPGMAIATLLAVALLSPRGGESVLLPLAPPLAVVAALGLPTVRRGVTSLIDWFAVMTFTLVGFVLWAYWIALQTGWPPRMANSVTRAVSGYEPTLNPIQLVLALAATVAWFALVIWRLTRRPQAIWRPVLLSSVGMVLTWLLLMTLWLPAGNHRKTYRAPAQQAGEVVGRAPGCVTGVGLNGAQRASFAYFGGIRFGAPGVANQDDCPWMLVSDDVRTPLDMRRFGPGWSEAWRGQRPADRRERFVLLRRDQRGSPSSKPPGTNSSAATLPTSTIDATFSGSRL
jgi:4-amino-4-deoxy-L-arabinose transferase-like glycosyltransferase